mgnify:CR=1 FL=1
MNKQTCIEQNCTFAVEGRSFTFGGAWIGKHKGTGRLGGVVYAYPKESKVGDWHGVRKVPAMFSREWRSNMGDTQQAVSFRLYGRLCSGVYYKSGSDIVRFREVQA